MSPSRVSMPFPPDTILVVDRSGSLQPFSKGLLASSVMAAAVAPANAHHVASVVAATLGRDKVLRLTADELAGLTSQVVAEIEGDAAAARYDAWRRVTRSHKPIIILLGGASGTGKSTIATALAARLSITRVIPTDAVREVMRGFVPESLVPELHRSSFEPPPDDPDASFETIYKSFRRQCQAVSAGVARVVKRMVNEREDAIIEGVHVLPGLDVTTIATTTTKAIVVPILLTVRDTAVHHAHFMHRLETHHGREPKRYLERLETIRAIDQRLQDDARAHDVATVDATFIDDALQQIIGIVLARAELALMDQGP
jgi:2-phosphoglycerate kinase